MKILYSLLIFATCLLDTTNSFADVTLTTSPVVASNILQGSNDNIVYIVKLDAISLPVTVNNIQFTLTGTHDNNDLSRISIYYNASTPSLSGALIQTYETNLFAAPHTYSLFIADKTIAAGGTGYFIITANTDVAATNGNTIKIDGAVNPVIFSYSGAPVITNNQSDIAGTQTILASVATLSTIAVAASNIIQGTNDNIVYIAKMDVAYLPVTVNSIQFTLSGTHDNNDLTRISIYYNATAPSMTGAVLLSYETILFAAPHVYTVPFAGSTIVAGGTVYFIMTINVDAAATIGNTVISDGAANPVIFGYTSTPNITNNQTNNAGTQTITGIVPLTLMSFSGNVMNIKSVELDWITSGELNTKDFDIEWSDNGLHFNKIGSLPASINSSTNKRYNFTDKRPTEGYNYYRLKINDTDGRSAYSNIIKIKVAITKTRLTIYPNPAKDRLYINGLINYSSIQISEANGKIIQKENILAGMQYINIREISAGVYRIILTGDKDTQTLSFIKI